MTDEEKANEIARDMLPYNNAEYHACYNSAIKAMQWKDKQYLNADFIFKVLQMAETYSDKRCKAAVATNIANELIMEKEL